MRDSRWRVGQLVEEIQTLAEMRNRFRARGTLNRALPGKLPAGDGGLAQLRVRVVPGQQLGSSLANVWRQCLESLRHFGVQGASTILQHALIGRLMCQRMRERMFFGRGHTRLMEEFRRLEAGQPGAQYLLGKVGHCLQYQDRDFSADDRCRLEEETLLVRQTVDAGHENSLDRVGHHDVGPKIGVVGHRTGALFQEERNTLGMRQDDLCQMRRQLVLGNHRMEHRQTVGARQTIQADLGGIRPFEPLRSIPGAVCRDQHDRAAGEAVRQRGEGIFSRLVDPLQILDGEDDRPFAAGGYRGLAQCLHGADFDRLWTQPLHGLDAAPATEEMEQVRCCHLALHPESLDDRIHFLGDHVRGIGVEDAEAVADDVDDGQIGDRVPIGQATALDVRSSAALEPLPELVKQA